MTTKRKWSKATSTLGVEFVRGLVGRHNCVYQGIDLDNDLGNDAYIEFVVEENATGCCIAAQIKSGKSYVLRQGELYAFSADRDHFQYWNSHTLPVVGIVFAPDANRAFWIDISAYLRANPDVVNDGPFTIQVPGSQELSDQTFAAFREYFLQYRLQYSSLVNLGVALDSFADRGNIERCYDGLHALFSFHRQQIVAWYYLVSCLSNYRGHRALTALVVRLCHAPGHGDIYWHKGNLVDEKVRKAVVSFMRERLDRRDAITLLTAIDEHGIARGTIGQCVHAIVDTMNDPRAVMESIALDASLTEDQRYFALILAIDYAQRESKAAALATIRRAKRVAATQRWQAELSEIQRLIKVYGGVAMY